MLSLLIVGDDPSLARLLSLIFELAGFEVESVLSISSARQSLAMRPFDIVLVEGTPDRMQCVEGRDQLRDLKASAPPRTMLGLLTTIPTSLRPSPEQLGFQFVIEMPFDVNALVDAVAQSTCAPHR